MNCFRAFIIYISNSTYISIHQTVINVSIICEHLALTY